jgi:hypothetical protein
MLVGQSGEARRNEHQLDDRLTASMRLVDGRDGIGCGPRQVGTRSVGRNVCCDGLEGETETDPLVRTDLDASDPNCSLRNS